MMPYRDPERQRKYQRESARRRRAGATAEKNRSTAPIRLASAEAVRLLLEECANEVRAARVDAVIRARTVARLCDVVLKALDMGELERRISALEGKVSHDDHETH